MNRDNDDDKWKTLPMDLLISIAERLDFPGSIKFAAVCKSWKSATCFPEVQIPKAPYLLLAEPIDDVDYSSDDDDDYSSDYSSDDDVDDDDDNNKIHNCHAVHGDHHEVANGIIGLQGLNGDVEEVDEYVERDNSGDVNNDKVVMNNNRGLFCLSTGKTYKIELPQASGKLILGTNKGWLLTLGKDLGINLLHPFSKQQIPLPPMLAFTTQHRCFDVFRPESVIHMFITKVAMSSHHINNHSDLPVIMTIYGGPRILAYARPRDMLWTDVKTDY